MRRVYDDSQYANTSADISKLITEIRPAEVSEYIWSMDRVRPGRIRDYLESRLPVKFGRNEDASGIGNNNALQIIVQNGAEEQICGLLHLTDDMFGGVYAWVSDIDGDRRTPTRHIR